MIWINKKLRDMREEEGFTLIELMVVVLIIAILIAIAIPTFLGARERAQNRAAQSSGRNALTGAKAIFTDQENYADATVAALTASEPALEFVSPSTDPNQVATASAAVGNPAPVKHNRFVAAVRADSNTCWYVQDVVGPTGTANSGTRWFSGAAPAAGCVTGDAPAYDANTWRKRP